MKRKPNEMRIRPDNVVQVALTKGRVALVDSQDWECVKRYRWCTVQTAHLAYASTFLKRENGKQKFITMHRLIMSPLPHLEVHHINGIGTDNRRSNLRICTRSQNMASARKHRDSDNHYRGVSRCRSGKWEANICVKYKKIRLGRFDTQIQAALAYNIAALEHFGEYANLNQMEEANAKS